MLNKKVAFVRNQFYAEMDGNPLGKRRGNQTKKLRTCVLLPQGYKGVKKSRNLDFSKLGFCPPPVLNIATNFVPPN